MIPSTILKFVRSLPFRTVISSRNSLSPRSQRAGEMALTRFHRSGSKPIFPEAAVWRLARYVCAGPRPLIRRRRAAIDRRLFDKDFLSLGIRRLT